MTTHSLDIPVRAVLKVVLTLGAVAILWMIRDIIAIVLFAIIIASAVSPAVGYLHIRRRIPRVIGALIIYIGFILLLAFALWIIVPPLVGQFTDLIQLLPGFIANSPFITENSQTIAEALRNFQSSIPELGPTIGSFFSNFFAGTLSVFGGVFSVLLMFVIAFYLSVEDEGIKKILRLTVPKQHHKKLFHAVEQAQRTFAAWVKGQFTLALIVGVLTYIGLLIIGVPFPVVLALIAALLELIPYVGPPLSAIPAVIIGFTASTFTGLLAIILYVIVQQIENNLLAPLVMRKAVGLDPLLVIVSLLVGAKLAGIVSMLLAVPLAAFAMQMLQDNAGYEFRANYENKSSNTSKRFRLFRDRGK